MSENNEIRKVFEDRQKDIYQGFEELSSYPDGKYLSHYVRCDFDWFQAAWEHQQIKIKELESQLGQANKKANSFLQCLMSIKDAKPKLMINQDGHEMFCYYFNPTKRARLAIDAAIQETGK